MYKCEVSADAPSFQTVSAEKPMTVQGKKYSHFTIKITLFYGVKSAQQKNNLNNGVLF